MISVGLDLAGVETRPTGFCMLSNMKVETCLLYTDTQILEMVKKTQPSIVAIDAPLSLPPGRKSLEEKNGLHLRECDRELLKKGIKFFPITLGPMRGLTKRGISLRYILETGGFRVIEAYPGGAQDVLGIPRKQKGIEKLKIGLENLGIRGLKGQISDHELDAITCAYVGNLYLDGKALTYGTAEEGIVMPKAKENHCSDKKKEIAK